MGNVVLSDDGRNSLHISPDIFKSPIIQISKEVKAVMECFCQKNTCRTNPFQYTHKIRPNFLVSGRGSCLGKSLAPCSPPITHGAENLKILPSATNASSDTLRKWLIGFKWWKLPSLLVPSLKTFFGAPCDSMEAKARNKCVRQVEFHTGKQSSPKYQVYPSLLRIFTARCRAHSLITLKPSGALPLHALSRRLNERSGSVLCSFGGVNWNSVEHSRGSTETKIEWNLPPPLLISHNRCRRHEKPVSIGLQKIVSSCGIPPAVAMLITALQ